MLSKNQVVAVRKAIELQYIGICTVIERQDYTKENKSTGQKDVIVLENQPCKLSFSNVPSTNKDATAARVIQTVKVFLAPELRIKPGSKLTITQNDVTNQYTNSGEPAFFTTHQEITLDLFKGWA